MFLKKTKSFLNKVLLKSPGFPPFRKKKKGWGPPALTYQRLTTPAVEKVFFVQFRSA